MYTPVSISRESNDNRGDWGQGRSVSVLETTLQIFTNNFDIIFLYIPSITVHDPEHPPSS